MKKKAAKSKPKRPARQPAKGCRRPSSGSGDTRVNYEYFYAKLIYTEFGMAVVIDSISRKKYRHKGPAHLHSAVSQITAMMSLPDGYTLVVWRA